MRLRNVRTIWPMPKRFRSTKCSIGTLRPINLISSVLPSIWEPRQRHSNPPIFASRTLRQSHDPELVSMYYQFGRYLLISSSQPGGQPANLQGIWNDSTNPAWDSKYTININTEMNYWPAEKCNMPELHEPLIQMVRELSETGQRTARDMYACDGWVAHHNTDIWRISGVVDGAFWGMWPMGSAWLSQHLWEPYLYNGDLKYLESVYPILKSACEFYQDFLIEEPTNKWLVVSPSISPENAPAGRPSVCAGATMDNQLLFDLFSKTIKAASLLNQDADLMARIPKNTRPLASDANWATRPIARMDGRFGQSERQAPPCVSFIRTLSKQSNYTVCHARVVRRSAYYAHP
jgi:hypothetical protein